MRDQKNQAAKEAKHKEKRIEKEPAQLTREQAIADDQEARRRKAKNQPPE